MDGSERGADLTRERVTRARGAGGGEGGCGGGRGGRGARCGNTSDYAHARTHTDYEFLSARCGAPSDESLTEPPCRALELACPLRRFRSQHPFSASSRSHLPTYTHASGVMSQLASPTSQTVCQAAASLLPWAALPSCLSRTHVTPIDAFDPPQSRTASSRSPNVAFSSRYSCRRACSWVGHGLSGPQRRARRQCTLALQPASFSSSARPRSTHIRIGPSTPSVPLASSSSRWPRNA